MLYEVITPSYGKPVVLYDANSQGELSYLNMARELLYNNEKVEA